MFLLVYSPACKYILTGLHCESPSVCLPDISHQATPAIHNGLFDFLLTGFLPMAVGAFLLFHMKIN